MKSNYPQITLEYRGGRMDPMEFFTEKKEKMNGYSVKHSLEAEDGTHYSLTEWIEKKSDTSATILEDFEKNPPYKKGDMVTCHIKHFERKGRSFEGKVDHLEVSTD